MEGSGESGGMSAGAGTASAATLDTSFNTDIGELHQPFDPGLEVESATQVEFETQSFEEFVSSPGSAHDKLTALSQMDESEDNDDAQDNTTEDEREEVVIPEPKSKEPSVEQKIMLLQAEALKLLAGKSGEKSDKEKDELLKKLKELMGQMQKGGDSVSASVLGVIFDLFNFLSKTGEKGTDFIEEQSKKSKRKN